MANTQRVVDIIFNGIDNVSEMSGKIGTNLSRVGAIIEDIAHPFAVLGQNILKVEAAIGALALGGLAYAITKSIDFEAASADLNKVLGEESNRLAEAQDQALELSQAYGVSSSEVLASMANFKQAGFSLSDAMTLTKASLDLVIAGDLDAAEASEILVSSLKGFKAPAEDSIRLTDILNEVSNNYATNVRELGVGMATISPIARTMGFSFEETAGILTPVIEVFRSGDEAAVALKTGLLKLLDDSKPVQEALASIGVSQKDANGQLRSGKEILYDVAAAFQHIDQNQKLFVASQLVGIHQAGRMVEVFDGLSRTTEVTATAMKAAGSAANEVRVRLETAEVSVNRFKAGFENLGIAIGLEFLEATKGAVEGGISIEETLQNLVKGDTFDPVFGRIRAFGEEFGDLLEGIAEAMPEAFEKVEFEELLASLDNLKGSFAGIFNAIFGDLDLTKPEDLAKAIQKVVDTVKSLTNITSGIFERFRPLIETFSGWTDEVNKWDEASQKAAGNRLADAMIIEKFGGIFGTVLLSIMGKTKDVEEAYNNLGVMSDPFGLSSESAKKAADTIGEIPGQVDAVKSSLEDVGTVDIVDPKATQADLDEVYLMMVETAGQITADLKASGGAKVPATADEESINRVKTVLDEKIPKERKVEVDLEKERIKAQAEIITASIESETEKWKSMFESVNTGIKSTGDVLTSFWETLAGGNLDIGQTMQMERYIEEENDRRRQEFDLQKKLTEQQIELNKLKIDALARGDALITIDGSGLQPHLEGFMFEVLEAIQVRVNATGAEFLLGIS